MSNYSPAVGWYDYLYDINFIQKTSFIIRRVENLGLIFKNSSYSFERGIINKIDSDYHNYSSDSDSDDY